MGNFSTFLLFLDETQVIKVKSKLDITTSREWCAKQKSQIFLVNRQEAVFLGSHWETSSCGIHGDKHRAAANMLPV